MRECIQRGCPPLPTKKQRISHCTVCHRDFSSNVVGDAHRVGPYEPPGARRCLSDEDMREKGYKPDHNGRWHSGPPEAVEAVHGPSDGGGVHA